MKLKHEIDLIREFTLFVSKTRSGRRVQKNGKRIAPAAMEYYDAAVLLLQDFSAQKKFNLRIIPLVYLDEKSLRDEKNYWKNFYHKFTDFILKDKNCYDNYAGTIFRVIKAFFNYMNQEKMVMLGDFHRQFYTRKEEIPIITLMPEHLSFLIHNKIFDDSLLTRQREIKNIFVFGCTVGLRYSDLKTLRPSNITSGVQGVYLRTISKKTGVPSQIKLPPFAIDILEKYSNKSKKAPYLFNLPVIDSFNRHLKVIAEKAGWTQEIPKIRSKRGEKKVIYKDKSSRTHYRFCDLIASHIMRRTTITNLLSLGVPETMVRQVSGHVTGSKEFYRYVSFAQVYLDQETEKAYKQLVDKF